MLERDHDSFYQNSHNLGKFILELIRNILVVATVRFLSEKSGSLFVNIIYWISMFGLGMYLFGYIWALHFKRAFFSETTEGIIFSYVLSFILLAFITLSTSALIEILVREVIRLQLSR